MEGALPYWAGKVSSAVLAQGAAEDLPRAFDVALDRRDQQLGRGEFFFFPDPLDEKNLHRLIVEVAVEVEEIALDRSRSRAESRVRAHARRGRPLPVAGLDDRRVDPVRGRHFGARGDVGGRIAEAAAAPLPRRHAPRDEMAAAQVAARRADLAAPDQRADAAASDAVAIELDGVDLTHGATPPFAPPAQNLHPSLSAPAETQV